MKTGIMLLAILVGCFGQLHTAKAQGLSAAERDYQEGLYLQNTVGDLDQALAAYDRALQIVNPKGNDELQKSILLRRAECFKLQGRSEELERTIASLEQKDQTAAERLGPARYFPAHFNMVFQINAKKLYQSPFGKVLFGALSEVNIKFEKDRDKSKSSEECEIEPEPQGAKEGGPLGPPHCKPKDKSGEEAQLREKAKKLFSGAIKKDLLLLNEKIRWLASGMTISEEPPLKIAVIAEGEFGELHLQDDVQFLRQEVGIDIFEKSIDGNLVFIFRFPDKQQPGKEMQMGLTKLGDQMLVFADLESLGDILKARAKKTLGLQANSNLQKALSRLPKEPTFWMAAAPSQILQDEFRKLGIPDMLKNLPNVSGVVLSGEITKDLSLNLTAWTEDLQSAKTLGDVLKGALALAHMALANEPKAAQLLQSLNVETKDLEVLVKANIPMEALVFDSK